MSPSTSLPERTEAQAEASRLNGAQSSGPVTEEGKAKAGRNAIKHGLCSDKLSFDDPEAEALFARIVERLAEVYLPTNDAERAAIRKMAAAEWREGVCIRMELALMHAIDRGEACAMSGGLGLPSLNTILRYKSRIERDRQLARAELEDLRSHRLPPVKSAAAGALSASMRVEPGWDAACTNEPGTSTPTGETTRERWRRLEKLGRKKRRK